MGHLVFQLTENFRMNEPITTYPRRVLYERRFESPYPDICTQMLPVLLGTDGSADLIDFLLDS